MRNSKLTLVMAIFCIVSGYAQDVLSVKGTKVKDGVVYLTVDPENKTLACFTSDKSADSKKEMHASTTFSLKDDNSCNLYLKWINPLKYKLTWKDSLYIDERDKAINEFVAILLAPFGKDVTSLGKIESKAMIEKSSKPALKKGEKIELTIPDGFNNSDLTLLYLQLRANQDKLTDDERTKLNEITKDIVELDDIIAKDVSKEADAIFLELFSLTNPSDVNNMVKQKNADVQKYEQLQAQTEKLHDKIKASLAVLSLSDRLLDNYTKSIVSLFLSQVQTRNAFNKNITDKIKPVIKIVENSVKDESEATATKGFFKVRSLEFEEGKKLQVSLTISEFDYKKEAKEFSKKGDLLTRSMTFQKYDFFEISVSSGIFYSSTTLRGYGVSDSQNGQFTVTEDDITSGNSLTAIFLNFNFGVGSRYLAPLLQIGADPTKKRPFFLVGGGFSIPSARLALSGGPVWAFNPSLDKLEVGDQISSTTELDQDVKYRFDPSPKGWYLGIQYNF